MLSAMTAQPEPGRRLAVLDESQTRAARAAQTAEPGTGDSRTHVHEVREDLEAALFEVKRVIVGQDAMLERLMIALLAGGHVLLEGVPGLAKTLTVKTLSRRPGRRVHPRAVHARPRPERPGRHAHLPARHRHVRRRARPGLRQLPARGRDQPRPREGPVRAARGHAGAPGHDRRRQPQRPGAVPRARHAEPDRVRGHLPAARGADRPLPVQGPRRLPLTGRGGRRRRPLARGRRRRARGALARPPRAPPRRGRDGDRRPRGHRLRRRARRRHALPRHPRARASSSR